MVRLQQESQDRLNHLLCLLALALSCANVHGQTKTAQIHVEAVSITTVVDNIDAGTGGLTIDREGNLYTADFGWNLSGPGKGGDKIMKVTPKGEVSVFCRGMRGASGNTMDSKGALYQSSIGGNFLSRVTPDGKVSVIARQGLKNPVGVVVDDKGQIYVCNCGGNTIQKFDTEGKSSIYCQSPLFKTPNGIVRADDGTLFVCNFGNGDVIKIDTLGKASRLATLPGRNNGHLTLHEGFLYVVARSDNRIYRVGLDGVATYFVGNGTRGKEDGKPNACSLSLPNSIVASPDGKYLYFNETSPISGDPRILGPTRIRRIELKRTKGGTPPAAKVLIQPNTEFLNAMQKARGFLGQQKFAQAENTLRPLAVKHPKLPMPTYLLAYSLHGQKKYTEARTLYQKSIQHDRLKSHCHYNIACTYAMEKNSDEAFKSLEAAIKAGFRDVKQVQNDSDFEAIKADPRFKSMISRLSQSK